MFVPVIATNCGSPAYTIFTEASAAARFTTAVVGTCASNTASLAICVPGTETSAAEYDLPMGIFAKSGGNSFAYTHAASSEPARNQRRENSTYICFVCALMKIWLSVFAPYEREVPGIGVHTGARRKIISSLGFSVTNTFGAAPAPAAGGTAFSTSSQFCPFGSFAMSGGSVVATVHGPGMSVAFSHCFPLSRK